MREFLLIPLSDYRQMENSQLEKSNENSITKNQILTNETLAPNVILDVFNRMIKNQRKGNDASLGSNSSEIEKMRNNLSKVENLGIF